MNTSMVSEGPAFWPRTATEGSVFWTALIAETLSFWERVVVPCAIAAKGTEMIMDAAAASRSDFRRLDRAYKVGITLSPLEESVMSAPVKRSNMETNVSREMGRLGCDVMR
jgi:hypothetical protein